MVGVGYRNLSIPFSGFDTPTRCTLEGETDRCAQAVLSAWFLMPEPLLIPRLPFPLRACTRILKDRPLSEGEKQ